MACLVIACVPSAGYLLQGVCGCRLVRLSIALALGEVVGTSRLGLLLLQVLLADLADRLGLDGLHCGHLRLDLLRG